MSASPTAQFEIPDEMRAVAERSVDQAKVAFQQLMQAAEEAVSTLERGEKSQVGALDISKKAMTFAERNVLSAFELAEKIVQTKDIQELGPDANRLPSVADASSKRAGEGPERDY